MKTRIRNAHRSDVEAITEIYNQAVALRTATADISPVSVESRTAWLTTHAPDEYPVFVAERDAAVVGWCSLSPYRPGRMALRQTAEISYYIHENFRGQGVGAELIAHALDQASDLGFRVLFAILLDLNVESAGLMEKFGFARWGHLPGVARFDDKECGHLYYGRRVGQDAG